MRYRQCGIALLVGTILLAEPLCLFAETHTGLTVTFATRGARAPLKEIASGDFSGITMGHAYMTIGVETRSGIKEEIFGFYPSSDGLHGLWKGPGMLKSEYRCGDSDDCGPAQRERTLRKLSETEDSVVLSITPEQRRAIYKELYSWNGKEYRLKDQNCIDFIAAVVTRLGYTVPARSSLQTPTAFLLALRTLITQEDQRRASEAKRLAAEKAASETLEQQRKAEEEAARLEEQRKAAAESAARQIAEPQRPAIPAKADTIPAGWILCQCPAQHYLMGKWIRGKLYHEASSPTCR